MGWERRRERGRRANREGENFRERVSTFSLDFRRSIRQTPAGQEAKLVYAARATCEYHFCGVLTTLRGRVFSYLFYSLAKGHFNGWRIIKALIAVFLVPKDLDRVKKSLEWFWTVCGLLVWLV